MNLPQVLAAIVEPNQVVAAETQRVLDRKTKPRGSLGRLEFLACQIAGIRGEVRPALPKKAIVVMAGDHGVTAEGVSAYPQEVTRQMVLNFAGGGAAINVLARQAGARLVVVDMGVKDAGNIPGVLDRRVGNGTANMAAGPAMGEDQATAAIEHGVALVEELVSDGVTLLGIGEMGIGNTTSASALVAAYSGEEVEAVTGRGTGVDDAGWAKKVAVIRRALAVNRAAKLSPLGVLAALGGFEIAGLAGVVLGAAALHVPVILDGFIASTAALAAVRIAPAAAGTVLPSHRSVEAGHRRVLERLGVRPILDLDMRLGEGTGAALAMHLVEASLLILRDM
ncbi:MAG TPA: nicotinate-nucleotide--dimethylbenzimidazole phosphoribosyltransferase, partial [Polyangia bacterium]